jgi:hypothetical protein
MSQQDPTVDGEQSDEDEPAAQAFYPNSGPDREGMVADYLPGSDDWQAKTNVDLTDPAAIAALKQFGAIYPEVDDLQDIIDGFLHEFLKTKTSVKGAGRDEYRSIMEAMYGKKSDDESSTAFQLVAAEDDE